MLKSPLIGLDEDALFSLCHDEGSYRVERLRAHDGAETVGAGSCKDAYWQPVRHSTIMLNSGALRLNRGERGAMYRRLGGAIDDSLNVFLQRARSFRTGSQARLSFYA